MKTYTETQVEAARAYRTGVRTRPRMKKEEVQRILEWDKQNRERLAVEFLHRMNN